MIGMPHFALVVLQEEGGKIRMCGWQASPFTGIHRKSVFFNDEKWQQKKKSFKYERRTLLGSSSSSLISS